MTLSRRKKRPVIPPPTDTEVAAAAEVAIAAQESDPAEGRSARWDGKDLLVTKGVREFKLFWVDGERRIKCLTCQLTTELGADPAAATAFYAAHEHARERTSGGGPAPAAITTDLDKLLADVRQLEGDELAVVRLVVDGLAVGRPQYGQLDVAADKRDFDDEGIAENRDQLAYDAMGLLRRLRARAARGGS